MNGVSPTPDIAGIVEVATPGQWQAYQDIRRTVLFEALGLTGHNANLSVLLVSMSWGNSEACVRTVAIA
ncbi:hypothetical protein HFO94_33625 [Rhizobium leguminosarum]|uniref:hypothetical protein n=1 Tax=Rhizobium TaxID=379 RepID=UPI001478D716|nr:MULTISPECIES: hypothetical protein [Rhizobium]MBY5358380.1 hypothetical protein [Rhizobium leguminosarum]NNH46511.1 hypothetical protein [Rhizobium laguerreae]